MRLHLFEFNDLAWFPSILRNLMTDFLRFQWTTLKAYKPIIPALEKAMESTEHGHEIVDLCSGAGGPAVAIQKFLQDQGTLVNTTLTDKFPNETTFKVQAKKFSHGITYDPSSIDANSVPVKYRGTRTLFGSFHHFRPEIAKSILQDAYEKKKPIVVCDGVLRSSIMILFFLFILPFQIFLITPFITPFRWERLLFTYIVPVLIPLIVWDGIVSCLRAYSENEIQKMVEEIGHDGYIWKTGKISMFSVWLIGVPTEEVSRKCPLELQQGS